MMYAARVEPGEPPLDTERRERTIVPLKRIDGLRRLLERSVKKHITFGAGRNLRGMIGHTLLPFIKALSDMTFSESLKIWNKVKKISATMTIHSKWNLYL
jgi:hemoglobin-like flavoprotein